MCSPSTSIRAGARRSETGPSPKFSRKRLHNLVSRALLLLEGRITGPVEVSQGSLNMRDVHCARIEFLRNLETSAQVSSTRSVATFEFNQVQASLRDGNLSRNLPALKRRAKFSPTRRVEDT